MTDQTSMYTEYQPPPAGTYPVDSGPESGVESGADTSMKDKAAESTQAGKQAVGDVAQTAADQAKEVAAQAQDQAKNLVGEARDQLRSHAGDQHRNAVSNLRTLGDELRSMASSSEQGGPASDLVGQAAGHAHRAADWLDGRRPEDLLGELRTLASRRPGAFLLGALAAGVVAGRVARGVVAAHNDDSGNGSGGNGAAGTTGELPTETGMPDTLSGAEAGTGFQGYSAPVYGGADTPGDQPYGGYATPSEQPYGGNATPSEQPYGGYGTAPGTAPYGGESAGGYSTPAGGGGPA